MLRDEGLATALFALVIGTGIAVMVTSDLAAPLCEAAKIKSAAPDKIEFGCFEFWLNRYQTILASFIALAAAAVAWIAAKRQIAAQQKANLLTEFAFWTQAYREDLQALATTTICIDVCMHVAAALRQLDENDDQPYRGVLEELHRLGLFPFAPVPTAGADFLAFYLNNKLKKANEFRRVERRIAIVTDKHLGQALGDIAEQGKHFIEWQAEIKISLAKVSQRRREIEQSLVH